MADDKDRVILEVLPVDISSTDWYFRSKHSHIT